MPHELHFHACPICGATSNLPCLNMQGRYKGKPKRLAHKERPWSISFNGDKPIGPISPGTVIGAKATTRRESNG